MLTEEIMFTASLLMWVWLVIITVILIRWHDWEVVWSLTLGLIQLLAVAYYGLQSIAPDSPLVPFPVVGLTIRPYLIGVWLLIFFYSIVRLRVKAAFRQHGS